MADSLSTGRDNGGTVARQQTRSVWNDLLGADPFRGLFGGMPNVSGNWGMEITRSGDGYAAEIPVAGFRPDQIEVTFQDDTLVVSGRSDRRKFYPVAGASR